MGRWTGNPEVKAVLNSADAWRDRCVADDGSILSDERLWTVANLDALRGRFRDNPIEGADRGFYDKLQEQLSGAPPELIHLAAEVVWFLLLFPHHTKFGPEKKAERVREVWAWSGQEAPDGLYLDSPSLMGVGNPGTAYLARLPDEFGFLVDTMAAWKARTSADRAALLGEPEAPWRFAAWLETLPGADRRPVRHALLFFLFPDAFESSVSTEHKRQILAAFLGEIPAAERPRGKRPTPLACDRALYVLRRHLEAERGDSEFSFYRPPYVQRWRTGVRDAARSLLVSSLEQMLKEHGLELHECGSKKRTLADCGEISEATGFWAKPTETTNKPLRWIVHLELEGGSVVARLAGQHGDRRIAFANTKGGISGMVLTRVVPAVRVGDGHFAFHEAWEWTLLLGFLPALPAGSSGQLLGDFDPATGVLAYMGAPQPYAAATLVALNESEDVFEHAALPRPIRYAEATEALAALINVVPTVGWPEGDDVSA